MEVVAGNFFVATRVATHRVVDVIAASVRAPYGLRTVFAPYGAEPVRNGLGADSVRIPYGNIFRMSTRDADCEGSN